MLISEVVTGNLCQLKGSTNPVKLVLFLQALYNDVTVASLLHLRPITTTFLLHTYETASLIVTPVFSVLHSSQRSPHPALNVMIIVCEML